MAININTLRPNTLKKFRAIQARFKHLYDVERRRIDDVQEILAREFFLSEIRIYEVLRLDLPEQVQPRDPNQLTIFTDEEE
jgi:hypothetical protein